MVPSVLPQRIEKEFTRFRRCLQTLTESEVDLPEGISTWQRNRGDTTTVPIGTEGLSGCRTDLFARPDGRISGWVVDDTGNGLAGFVTVKPADPKEAEAASRRGGLPGYTTEDGYFTLWLLPPGRYRLQFQPKIDGNISSRSSGHLV